MRERGLSVKPRRQTVRTSDGGCREAVFPNLARDFVPGGSNELWVGDITYIHTRIAFAYPGGDPGRLVAARGRLRGVAVDRHTTYDRGAAGGAGKSPAGARLHSSHRPRQPVRLGGLSSLDGRVGPAGIDEPARKSLRQRSMRKLHQNGEMRRRVSERIRDLPGCGESLTAVPGPGLQSKAAPFGTGLPQSSGFRGTICSASGLIPSPSVSNLRGSLQSHGNFASNTQGVLLRPRQTSIFPHSKRRNASLLYFYRSKSGITDEVGSCSRSLGSRLRRCYWEAGLYDGKH